MNCGREYMTEKERFEFTMNAQGQVDIVDWVESEEKNAICIYNDLGVLPFTSAKALCNLLNDLWTQIVELEKEKDSWKSNSCSYVNFFSILSNEISILQETKDIDRFIDKYYKYYPYNGFKNEDKINGGK